mgnify:CR=1 FL=1|tara:strand:- start:526 stop:1275 length:750 start_codon:yes stop_codon:yes gene_type:complete
MNKKISMVVMNWLRPHVLTDVILPVVTKYKLIDEIIISHGRGDTYFEYDNPKILNRKDWVNNEAYGLSLRFLAALDAKNDTILMIDDDCYPDEFALKTLYNVYIENPNRIVGSWGRILRAECKYNYVNSYGDVMITLTKCMLFKKELGYEFFKYAPIASEIIKEGKPFWNGEDIFMSAVATNYYGNPNYAVPGILQHMKDNVKSKKNHKRVRGVCSWRGHMRFRTKMSRFCNEYFKIWNDGYLPKKGKK